MKKIIYSLIFVLFCTSAAFSDALLHVGDNLTNYLKTNPPKFTKKGPAIDFWPECKIVFGAYDKNYDGNTPIILFANDDDAIGVLQGLSPNAYYLYDINGDGVLDTKTSNIIFPYWIVYNNSKNKTKNYNIAPIFNLTYDSFQSDEGPYNNPKLKKSFEEIRKYKDDPNMENRDLVFLFLFYQTYSQKLMDQSLECLNILIFECNKRFEKVHPILLLYKAETLINLNRNNDALKIVKELLKIAPNFVPGLVYEYTLEPDKQKKMNLLAKLKTNYPNHWIVRQL